MRLIKLAAFALFGYALYEFVRGMLNDTQLGNQLGDALNRVNEGQGKAARRPAALASVSESLGSVGESIGGVSESIGGLNISGPGAGEQVSTIEADGGSVRHKVGRGVIR